MNTTTENNNAPQTGLIEIIIAAVCIIAIVLSFLHLSMNVSAEETTETYTYTITSNSDSGEIITTVNIYTPTDAKAVVRSYHTENARTSGIYGYAVMYFYSDMPFTYDNGITTADASLKNGVYYAMVFNSSKLTDFSVLNAVFDGLINTTEIKNIRLAASLNTDNITAFAAEFPDEDGAQIPMIKKNIVNELLNFTRSVISLFSEYPLNLVLIGGLCGVCYGIYAKSKKATL